MAAFLFGTAAMGQTVALKTNLLYDATATVNAGLELGMAPQWTIDLNGNYNGWSTGGIKKWEHILVNPEVRYWLCERFAGHFFGLHAIGQQFNIGGLDFGAKILGTDFSLLKDHLYKGWGLGAGIGYGYNYTPNQGRLLLHLSAAPLLVFFTKNFMTASIPLPIDEEEVLELELNSEVKTKHKYFLTAIMRASAFYNINDHFYLGATALLNNMRFDSEDNVKLQMKDWIVNAQFGIRF